MSKIEELESIIAAGAKNVISLHARIGELKERAEKAEAEIAAMHKAAEEEAGHEMGLWTIGAVATVARLKAEREQFRKEAERYLTARRMASRGVLPTEWMEGFTEKELDAAIDSARNK